MNKHIWIIVATAIFNVSVFLFFLADFIRARDIPRNVGGTVVLLFVAFGLIVVLQLIATVVVVFTKETTIMYITAIVSSLLSMCLLVVLALRVNEIRKNTSLQTKWIAEAEDARKMADSPEGRRRLEFREAILANDGAKVKQLIDEGERATDEDLEHAVLACFQSNENISTEIFQILLANGADVRMAPSVFTHNVFCRNFGTVELLLRAGANPLPREDYFPIVCLPQLQLLVEYGADINLLSETYYDVARKDGASVGGFQNGRWTPVMIYLDKYPAYFEETKFLISQKCDLKYADENGYTVQLLLEAVIKEQEAMGNSVKELIELRKAIAQ